MARGFTTLSAVLLLTGLPGLGQIIIPGVGYPGGGYPGSRRYPQQNPNANPNANEQPSNASMTGILRKIEDKDVIIEGDDQAITTIAVTGSTKFRDTTGKSTNVGDFQPGDHVRIDTKQEHNNANLAYRALTISMVREGTMDEHAAASQASDDPTHPITKGSGNSTSASSSGSDDPNRPVLHRASGADSASNSSSSSSDDNDPDRPRLHRASGSDSSGSSSSSSNTASNSSSSSSSDDDPDRPRLHRADSSNAGNSSSSTAGNSTPPAQSNPDSSATVAARRPYSTPSSSDPDDAPPVLRRTPSGTGSSSSNDSTTTVADARPSIHAADTNGVTQLPSQPVVGPPEPETTSGGLRIPNRLAGSGDDVIDQARQAGFSYSETLPNYTVKQFTTRYETQAARGGHTSWQALDEVTADVLEVNGVEQYKNILVNGHPPREDISKTGSWSSGEFSSLLLDILSPATNADFHGKRSTTIANRSAFRYDFSVQQANSHWHIESESQSYMPAYTGSIWIDKQTYRALRIELSAERMPSGFPLDTVESAVDYDFVQIGDGKFLLPVHSEALSCGRGTSDCSRNVIEFRNYRKFSADTSITFDTTSPP